MQKPLSKLSPLLLALLLVMTVGLAFLFSLSEIGYRLDNWRWDVFGKQLLFMGSISAIAVLLLVFGRKR